jgi:urate oxidase
MLTGGFDVAFVQQENSAASCTITNIINIVAQENRGLDAEDFCQAVTVRFLERYPQVETVTVQGLQIEPMRMAINGGRYPNGFVADCHGQPFAGVFATHAETKVLSGVSGLTFTKSIVAGCDRMCATAMEASWLWGGMPADYSATNSRILATMLEAFATTYSESVRDRLYRMGRAALAAVPEIVESSLACPDRHYSPIDLRSFGLPDDNIVSLPTDASHHQIECTVVRD